MTPWRQTEPVFIVQGLNWRVWYDIAAYATYTEARAHLTRISDHVDMLNPRERKAHSFRIIEVKARLGG